MNGGRRGFTLFEIMLVVALAGILATLVVSRIAPGNPDGLISLNGYLSEARSEAMDRGPFILTVSNGLLSLTDASLKPVVLRSSLPGGTWRIIPDRIFIYRDGSCSTGRLYLDGGNGKESFLLAVTVRAYEDSR